VVEKHLIDALMDDPDVEVNMVAVASYPVVDATPIEVVPVEVPLATEAWMEVEDELPGEKPTTAKPKPVPRKRSN
jgi:hypothetical protein